MAATVRSTSAVRTAVDPGTNSATINYTSAQMPTGYTAGDILVAIVAANDLGFTNAPNLNMGTTPTGWTLVRTTNDTSTDLNVYTRTATGTTADAFGVTMTFDTGGSSSGASAVILAIQGAATPTVSLSQRGTTSVTVPATGATNSLLLLVSGSWQNSTAPSSTGMTSAVSFGNTGATNPNNLYASSLAQTTVTTHAVTITTGFPLVAVGLAFDAASTAATGSATVIGAGVATALARQIATATATGAGVATAAGSVPTGATASATGAGAVTALARQQATATATGAGVTTAAASIITPGNATATGAGVATGAGSNTTTGTATVTGAGVATATGTTITLGSAAATGAGSVTTTVRQTVTATATGTGTATAATGYRAAALATGAGSVTASAYVTTYGQPLRNDRVTLTTYLASASWTTYDTIPPSIQTPAVIIQPDDPYLEPLTIDGAIWKVNYLVTCAVNYVDNQGALYQLENLAQSIIAQVPDSYTLGNIAAPTALDAAGSTLLTLNLPISTMRGL